MLGSIMGSPYLGKLPNLHSKFEVDELQEICKQKTSDLQAQQKKGSKAVPGSHVFNSEAKAKESEQLIPRGSSQKFGSL